MTLSTVAEAATIVGGGVAAAGAVLAVARYWVRHELKQLRPNGGSHLVDKVSTAAVTIERIDTKLDVALERVSKLEGRFDEHVRAGRHY